MPDLYDDHREAMLKHARRRAWQRYGFALAKSDLERLARRLNRGVLLWRQRDGREAWEVSFRGVRLIVVYDTDHAALVSFLPWKARFNEPTKAWED